MTNRPCKPDADLQGIWQMFLPDVPLPACGLPDSKHASGSESTMLGDPQLNGRNEQARPSAPAVPQPPEELL